MSKICFSHIPHFLYTKESRNVSLDCFFVVVVIIVVIVVFGGGDGGSRYPAKLQTWDVRACMTLKFSPASDSFFPMKLLS